MPKLQVLEYQSAARVPARRIELPEMPHRASSSYVSSGRTSVLYPETRLVTLRALEGNWGYELKADGFQPPLHDTSTITLLEGESMSFGIRQDLVGFSTLCLNLVSLGDGL